MYVCVCVLRGYLIMHKLAELPCLHWKKIQDPNQLFRINDLTVIFTLTEISPNKKRFTNYITFIITLWKVCFYFTVILQ